MLAVLKVSCCPAGEAVPADDVRFPFKLILRPGEDVAKYKRTRYRDPSQQLAALPPNTVLFHIYAVSEPIPLSRVPELECLGKICTSSEFRGSAFGDQGLFFKVSSNS